MAGRRSGATGREGGSGTPLTRRRRGTPTLRHLCRPRLGRTTATALGSGGVVGGRRGAAAATAGARSLLRPPRRRAAAAPRPAPLPGGAMLDTSTMLQVFGLGIPESLGFVMPEPPARKPLCSSRCRSSASSSSASPPSSPHSTHTDTLCRFAPGAPHTPTPIHATQGLIARRTASADSRLTIRSDAFARAVHSGGSRLQRRRGQQRRPSRRCGRGAPSGRSFLGGTLDDHRAPPPPSVPPPSALLDGDAEVWQGWPKKRDWTAAQQHAAGDDGGTRAAAPRSAAARARATRRSSFCRRASSSCAARCPTPVRKRSARAREWASAALCVGLKQRLNVAPAAFMPSSHLPPPPADGLAANASSVRR